MSLDFVGLWTLIYVQKVESVYQSSEEILLALISETIQLSQGV